jgi:septal ring factor EnvC (AmiA/AmiB activator)
MQADLPELHRRLVDLYKLGHGGYLRLLLSTSDVRRIGHAVRTVAMLAKSDRDRVEGRRRQLADLQNARATLEARESQLAALRETAKAAEMATSRAVQERNALIRQIDARRDLTARLAGELQLAHERLQQTLSALPSAGPASQPAVLPLGPFRGDLDWPADGPVRRRFRDAPGEPPTSSGIEIGAGEGSPVRAVHEGTVVFADTFTGFGNLVILGHDAQNLTLYGHLLDVPVTRGARVAKGDVIGSVGISPAGGAGLYFELRVDARPVDPLQWLRKR